MRARINGQAVEFPAGAPGDRIDARDLVDLVAEELDADGVVLVGGPELQDVAADAEGAAAEVVRRPLVLHLGEAAEVLRERLLHTPLEEEEHAEVEVGIADTVDARHRGDDDDVAPLEDRLRGRQAQLVDLVVLGHLLFDVEIVLRDVGLGLVVVVVGDEVLDAVLREEVLELLVKLRGEGFVVAEDERRPIDGLDDLGDGEGLPRAGHAEEHLVAHAGVDALDELFNGLGLVALGVEG